MGQSIMMEHTVRQTVWPPNLRRIRQYFKRKWVENVLQLAAGAQARCVLLEFLLLLAVVVPLACDAPGPAGAFSKRTLSSPSATRTWSRWFGVPWSWCGAAS